ncbi:MAG: hypothetical protein R3F50_20195 [Gammaproteobacteria bacterium]|jgi:hypothetical protein
MNELRRLAYLRAMGIDCYERHSQAALADADNDAVISDPERVASAGKAALSVRASTAAGPAASALDAMGVSVAPAVPPQAGTGSRSSSSVTPEPTASIDPPADAEAQQLRFSMQFYPATEKLALISEIPFMGNERIVNGTSRLLQAILHALDVESEQTRKPDRFNWPLGLEDDASIARAPEAFQALQGFLRKRLESAAFAVIVVFGNQSKALFAQAGVDTLLAGGDTRVIYTHSLGAMLQVPTLKRSVWEDIRVIRSLLEQ